MSTVAGVAVFCISVIVAKRTFKFVMLLVNKLFDWGESKIS